jgi:hypothetical protein
LRTEANSPSLVPPAPGKPGSDGRAHRWWLRLALPILLCGPAFVLGRADTRGLSWPPGTDFYRDIAQAQTMADGALLADPFYRGETLWYNPLVPGLVAALADLSGRPVHVLYVQAGAYLNLLAPVAFFLLIEACFGLPTAAVATLHLVYLRDPAGPSWLSPAYSPWLFSAGFVQGLFYLTLLAYRRALQTDALGWFAATGALLGLTFLGHAAPALLLGVIAAVGLARDARTGKGRKSLFRHALLAGVALLAAAPLLWSILLHYRLRILNPAPLDWIWPPMSLPELPAFMETYESLPATVLAVIALLWLIRRDPRRREASLLATWALAAAVFFGLSLLREATGFGPRLVPRHHFLFYWRAAESALLGYGGGVAAFALGRRLGGSLGRLAPAALVLAVAAAVAVAFPSYRQREVFTTERRDAERDDSRLNRQEAGEWIRAHSAPDDVFLAADDLALMIVGPAGRKVVALDAYFSSPYVDWQARHEARDALVTELREQRFSELVAQAKALGVGFVIRKRSDRWGPDDAPVLHREFTNARIGIYRLVAP